MRDAPNRGAAARRGAAFQNAPWSSHHSTSSSGVCSWQRVAGNASPPARLLGDDTGLVLAGVASLPPQRSECRAGLEAVASQHVCGATSPAASRLGSRPPPPPPEAPPVLCHVLRQPQNDRQHGIAVTRRVWYNAVRIKRTPFMIDPLAPSRNPQPPARQLDPGGPSFGLGQVARL
jgi:hypothetical protein